MKQSKKEKMVRIREENARRREEECQILLARKYRPSDEFVQLKPRAHLMERNDAYSRLPSGPSHAPVLVAKKVVYEGEMLVREAAAAEETERKKKMVAPICNKGNYVYVGDVPPEIVRTLGRKV